MAFENIRKLNPGHIEPGFYFLDANVWVYALQNLENERYFKKIYADFFFNLIESEVDPCPLILMPTLLISEIINTYLYKIALPEYKEEQGIPKNTNLDFKKEYRFTDHCKENFERIMDDIHGYKKKLQFISDQNLISKVDDLLPSSIGIFDYNDYVYYQLCKEQNQKAKVTIVTNDGDFKIRDLPVFTLNSELYNLKLVR